MNKIARTLSQFYRQINAQLAGWHMSKKVHEYLIEALLIVFSVILALFLNEYRNNLKAENELEKTLSNLTIEIEKNREIVQGLFLYHQRVYNKLALISQNNSAIDSLKIPFVLNFSKLFPQGIVRDSPGNSAWQVLLATGQLSQIEIDQAQLLSKLYYQQETTFEPTDKIYDFLTDRGNLNPSEVKDNLLIISLHMAELYQREEKLLIIYNEALEFLKEDQKEEKPQ